MLKFLYTFRSAASNSEPKMMSSVIFEAVGEDLVVIKGSGVKDSSVLSEWLLIRFGMVKFAGLFLRESLDFLTGTGWRLKIEASGAGVLHVVVLSCGKGVGGSSWQDGCELNRGADWLKLNIVVIGILCICI